MFGDDMKSRSQREFPRIKPFIKWVRVSDNEIRAYDPSTCMYCTLQHDSARVWELLDGKHSIIHIAMAFTLGVAAEEVVDQIFQKIYALLNTLEERGIIEYSDTPIPESNGLNAK